MPARASSAIVRTATRKLASALMGLGEAIEQLGQMNTNGGGGRRSAGSGRARRRRTITPRARAFLKLQGKYLGLMRHLPRKHRARVKAIKASKGYEPAIKEAVRLSSR